MAITDREDAGRHNGLLRKIVTAEPGRGSGLPSIPAPGQWRFPRLPGRPGIPYSRLWAAAVVAWRVAIGPSLATLLSLSFLLACTLLLFRTSLLDGLYYYRSDTVTYYHPIADSLVDVLRQGKLLLWTPDIFGGFPLFADGESGMLYPPNLLAYLLMPEESAILWLRISRYFLAAAFTYAYLQTLRLNRVASVIGALIFAFGSFMVIQMHHTNVGNTAIWLPLTLALVELSVRNVRRWRWAYAILAGATVGIQALALHIQPLLMSGMMLGAYLPFRVLLCPIAWPAGGSSRPGRRLPSRAALSPALALVPSRPRELVEGARARLGVGLGEARAALSSRAAPWRGRTAARFGRSVRLPAAVTPCWRVCRGVMSLAIHSSLPVFGWLFRQSASLLHRGVLTLLLLVAIPATAFGIAAVQILPLAELGLFSFRGTGVSQQFATSYSMPIQNLINLIFPYFFRYTNRFYWSLWSEWETTIYLGIASLALVAVAIIFVRNRLVLFFALVAGVSLVLAFGGYSPYPLWEQVRQLPGFSSLRVPGRFTMLTNFSAAVLAAFGADWLCRNLRPWGPPSERSGWSRVSRGIVVNGFAAYLVGLLAALAALFWWLFSFRSWVDAQPLAAKRFLEEGYLALRSSKPWMTSDMVLNFLDYSLDPANERTAASLALMAATFLLLFCWFTFRRLWRVWSSLLVVLVAADMLFFAMDFHPTMPMSQLHTPDGPARWLAEHNDDGMQRVYTARDVRKTEANRLLPYRVPEITGYSSLQTTRHLEYMARAIEYDKPLLDLYNTRYVVLPKRFPALASYEYTAYHPDRPLADGPRDNRGAHVTFYMNPAVKADEVSFISSLRDAVEIPQDAEVAEIVVVDSSGERVTLKLKAGKDSSEWAYDRPDVTKQVRHQKARVADKVNVTDSNGISYQANLYFGEYKLDKTRTVSRVEFHYTHPQGKMRLYGLMLWENPDKAHQVLGRNKFIPRYEDDEVVIAENPSRLPRAFLVPTARIVNPAEMLSTMANGNFDPEKVVLLEPGQRPSTREVPRAANGLPDAKELARTAERWLQGSAGVANPRVIQDWLRGNAAEAMPGSATITSYGSDEVVIRTRGNRNALLFLSDTYYPGWKALVDGQEKTIYRANSLFRGVLVPAGEHEVRFVFEPESFILGSEISIFSASAVLALLALLILSAPLWRIFRWGYNRLHLH